MPGPSLTVGLLTCKQSIRRYMIFGNLAVTETEEVTNE